MFEMGWFNHQLVYNLFIFNTIKTPHGKLKNLDILQPSQGDGAYNEKIHVLPSSKLTDSLPPKIGRGPKWKLIFSNHQFCRGELLLVSGG